MTPAAPPLGSVRDRSRRAARPPGTPPRRRAPATTAATSSRAQAGRVQGGTGAGAHPRSRPAGPATSSTWRWRNCSIWRRRSSSTAAANGLPLGFPLVSPAQLAGLEINEYARELAQVVVWIGYLQWKLGNGFPGNDDPILKPLETIRLQDALLDRSEPGNPKEAEWPAADFIIGNPPFLGGNRIRAGLGDSYLAALFLCIRRSCAAFRRSGVLLLRAVRVKRSRATGAYERGCLPPIRSGAE